MDKIEEYWLGFLETCGKGKDELPFGGEAVFGIDEIMCMQLTALILSGRKQATTSVLEAYRIDNERLPVPGQYFVVTDWYGEPCGIIREDKVDILPFNQVPWSMAEMEGEDESLESWRRNHIEAFEEDGDIMGYEFTPETPVVFEQFHLVYKK